MHPIDRSRGGPVAQSFKMPFSREFGILPEPHPPHPAFESRIGLKRNEGWVDIHECAQTRSCVEAAIKPI